MELQPQHIPQLFIGVKLVEAQPMTRAAYNDYRGWTVPENETGADEGYLVVYQDGGKPNDSRHTGYISWSPKEQFDKAYRVMSGLTFGMAIEAMKKGFKVTRNGWNAPGMWIALGEGNAALPASSFWNTHSRQFALDNGGVAPVRDYFILKTAQGEIAMGWSPSQSDALANDWFTL